MMPIRWLRSVFSPHLMLVGHLNPEDVRQALERHEPRFGDATWRQSVPGTAHADTESIYLRMPPEITFDSVFHSHEVVDCPMLQEPAFRNALEDLQSIVQAPIARAMLVRLKSDGEITRHVDEGEYSAATERYHWCITTNPACYVMIGDEVTHMRPGEVWFFDKHAEHAVSNGPTPRVHLIFDVWTN